MRIAGESRENRGRCFVFENRGRIAGDRKKNTANKFFENRGRFAVESREMFCFRESRENRGRIAGNEKTSQKRLAMRPENSKRDASAPLFTSCLRCFLIPHDSPAILPRFSKKKRKPSHATFLCDSLHKMSETAEKHISFIQRAQPKIARLQGKIRHAKSYDFLQPLSSRSINIAG